MLSKKDIQEIAIIKLYKRFAFFLLLLVPLILLHGFYSGTEFILHINAFKPAVIFVLIWDFFSFQFLSILAKKKIHFTSKIDLTPDFFIKKYKISNRENEILNLLIQNYSNNEIKQKLFISIKTVEKHISNIFKKTEVSTRNELIQKIHLFR